MRILCLTTSFPSSPDDPSGFFIYQQAQALTAQGLTIRVLTPQSDAPPSNWPESIHVRRFSYAPRRWQILAQRPGGIPAALRLNRKNYMLAPSFLTAYVLNILAHSLKADLVLANWAVSGALAWYLSPLHRKPVITVLRGSDAIVKNGVLGSESPLRKAGFRGSEAVVCVGRDQEKAIKKASGNSEKVRYNPNGNHERFFHATPPEPGDAIHIMY
ncbi:MAG: glycosyltransferase, partial [Deltaproteobacteria bacterium]|nr:glycosyltransferase [Deltaproteobacteria bacterium]